MARLLLYHLLSAFVALANPSLMPSFHHLIYILNLNANVWKLLRLIANFSSDATCATFTF